jgi:hypothetical protein
MVNDSLIQKFADLAANGYVKDKVPLNEAIVKIAREESLTAEAVARVVERANTGVQVCLFSELGPKETFEFPLASTKEVLASLNANAIGQEYVLRESPEPENKNLGVDKLSNWTGDLTESDWDPRHPTHEQVLMIANEQFKAAREEMRARVIESESNLEKTAAEFVDGCKQEIASGEWTADELAENMAYFRPTSKKLAYSLIKQANEQCHHTRPVDSAEGYNDTPPAFLTNEGNSRPVKVLDSNHSLIITLDTLVDQARQADCHNKGLYIIDDKVQYIQTQVKDALSREYEKEVR